MYLVFNFLFYSFIGWIIEGLFSIVIRGQFERPGFLVGPFKPMYGIAMSILIWMYYILEFNFPLMLLMCLLVPTTVEYISGEFLRGIFKEDYWDYSMLKWNYRGLITLQFSVYWTILSYIGVACFQRIINYIFENNIHVIYIGTIFTIVYLLIDILVTIRYKHII